MLASFADLVARGVAETSAPMWEQGDRTVSRTEASEMIARIRQALRARSLRQGDRIAVHADPTPESLAMLLGAMLEQLVVVPIDPGLTVARKVQMLELSRPLAIATGEGVDPAEIGQGLVRFDMAAALGRPLTGAGLTAQEPEAEPCYIFFTSGSTGVPKPVLGRRSGLAHFMSWERDMLMLSPTDRVALLTRFSFDVVLRDILLPLVAGCTSVLPDPGRQLDARGMLDWVSERGITVMHSVPSVAHAMLKAAPSVPTPGLRHTLFAGEPLNGGLVDRWRAQFPGVIVHNLYGPTETTLAKFHARVPTPPLSGIQACGRALPGTQVAIVAEDGQAAPQGTLGEVAICTAHGSLGYVDVRNEPDGLRPIMTAWAGKPHYMTGDLGYLDSDGALHLRGRKDDQVKVMGVRLELAGIAAALEMHPQIDKAVVLAEADEVGQKSLLAWYVPREGSAPSLPELRIFLADHLPPAGIPGQMFAVSDIPLTANGKVDKQNLPRFAADHVAPEGELETLITERFAALFEGETVGATTDFFALGGDSLVATMLCIDLAEQLGKEVAPGILLDAPTPRDLARVLGTRRNDDLAPFAPAPAEPEFALTPQQRRYLRTFLAGGNRNWCNMVAVIPLPDHVTANEVTMALRDISVHHDSLRLSFALDGDGTPRQSIRPNSRFELAEIDLSNLPQDAVAPEIARLKIREAEQPIPVFADTALFRATLLRLPSGGRKLLWNVHHLVSDGTSQGILAQNLSEWLADSNGYRERHADLPSFRDLAHAVNSRAGAAITGHFPHLLSEPTVYRHSYLPNVRDVADPQRCLAFDAALADETMQAARARARALKCTPYVILVAGYFRMLSRLTGQSDMAIVTPLAGREHPQARVMIGDLINLVPHRIHDLDRLDAAGLVARVRQLVTEAARHQDDQFDQVLDALDLPFPKDRNALTGFSLNYMPQSSRDTPALRLHSDRGYKLKYDMLFLMRDHRNCLNVEIQYRAGLFDQPGIEALFDQYETTLKAICNDS